MSSIKVDIHIHSKFSRCSSLTVDFLVDQTRKSKVPVVVCTDHGDIGAVHRLMKELPDTLIIPAVEVEADEGDFLVYSGEIGVIDELAHFEGSVSRLAKDAGIAVVWAHPRLSQHVDFAKLSENYPERGLPDEEMLMTILPHIDGLEYFNGTILDLAASGLVRPTYFKNMAYLAQKYHLARTGGSDAHQQELWLKVWTEFPEPLGGASDFVRAIKESKVRPNYDHDYFKTRID